MQRILVSLAIATIYFSINQNDKISWSFVINLRMVALTKQTLYLLLFRISCMSYCLVYVLCLTARCRVGV